MSAEHKRPLYAFAAVMVVCVMIIAHAVHSQALTRFLGPTSPMIVAAGPHLIPAPSVDDPARLTAPEATALPVSGVRPTGAVIRRSSGLDGPRPGRKTLRAGKVSATKAAPGKLTAPGQAVAAGSSSSAPGKAGTAPGKAGTAPGKAGTAPGKAGTAPGQARASAGKVRAQAAGRGKALSAIKGHGAKRPARTTKAGPSVRGSRDVRRR